MKTYNIFLMIFSSLIISGCSSNYFMKDFDSKADYYSHFNDNIEKQSTSITLKDTLIKNYSEKIIISNDSLILSKIEIIDDPSIVKLPLNSVEDIDYYDQTAENLSADILLNDGEKIMARNIKFVKDSIHFNKTTTINKQISYPIDRVKKISYESGFLGGIIGLPVGALSGLVIGAFTKIIPAEFSRPHNPDEWYYDHNVSSMYGVAAGTIIGTVLGWLIGYDYVYHF